MPPLKPAAGNAACRPCEDSHDDGECYLGEHAVLIVGWGEYTSAASAWSSAQFWTVKNYWGARWGESGFFRVTAEQHQGAPAPRLMLTCFISLQLT